jgi:hypothetical protein
MTQPGPDRDPGGRFDPWSELKFAIAELHALAARLTVHLDADDDHQAIIWDEGSWRAADLLERALADVGTLSAQYLRLMISDRRGTDPLA